MNQQEGTHLQDFYVSYTTLISPLPRKRFSDERLLHDLREIFCKLYDPGSFLSLTSTDRLSWVRCLEDTVTPEEELITPAVMETRADYNLIKAQEVMGNAYIFEGGNEDAYNIYNMEYTYFVRRFGRNFVKSRELKKKMGKALLRSGDYKRVIKDLILGVEQEETLLDKESAMYIKYAYGRALMSMGKCCKDMNYLIKDYMGRMENENEVGGELTYSYIKRFQSVSALTCDKPFIG